MLVLPFEGVHVFTPFLGPGHFMEVAKLLPLLTAASPDHPSFHVVAFSLPGFGFSETPKKKGFAITQYAEVNVIALAYFDCFMLIQSCEGRS